MTTFEALLLGAVQGITEFLPISSSGHLTIGHHLLGGVPAAENMLFDILVHVGTLVAVFMVFGKDVLRVLREFVSVSLEALRSGRLEAFRDKPMAHLGLLIVVGTAVTGVVGMTIGKVLNRATATPTAVGVALLVNAAVLLGTRFAVRRPISPGGGASSGASGEVLASGGGDGDGGSEPRPSAMPLALSAHPASTISWKAALLVGIGQGLAVTRGISRSGTTIALGLFMGMDRQEAARFSFLLAIPAIFGAMALELAGDGLGAFLDAPGGPLPYLVGFGASALTGCAALVVLLRVLRRGALYLFAPYCVAAGLFAIWLGF